jgi:hypothetical protein
MNPLSPKLTHPVYASRKRIKTSSKHFAGILHSIEYETQRHGGFMSPASRNHSKGA